jgi:hypothetical protein
MIGIYLLAAVLFVQDQTKPLPDLKPFLAEVRKTLRPDRELLSNYTYTEKRTRIDLDSDGKPKNTEVNVFQVFPGKAGRPGYQRQIVKDGKPVSDEELKKADQEREKQLAEIQRKIAARTPEQNQKSRAERDRKDAETLDDVFGGYEFQILGREEISGKPVIVVQFKPRPGYNPKTSDGKNMQHLAGRAWISEEDHQLARVEMEVIDTISLGFGILARLQKGATLKAERQKFNDEIWLPMRTEVTLKARFLVLKGFNLRQITEYSEHKKYSVDTILKFPDLEKPVP